jgi:hypothetical protein
MLREHIQTGRLPIPWTRAADRGRDIEAKEILKVLRRAATDDRFIARVESHKVIPGQSLIKSYRSSRRTASSHARLLA